LGKRDDENLGCETVKNGRCSRAAQTDDAGCFAGREGGLLRGAAAGVAMVQAAEKGKGDDLA
jgi:hypothetical protein